MNSKENSRIPGKLYKHQWKSKDSREVLWISKKIQELQENFNNAKEICMNFRENPRTPEKFYEVIVIVIVIVISQPTPWPTSVRPSTIGLCWVRAYQTSPVNMP